MKKAENRATRKGFMLQQCIREALGVRQLRGRHHNAPASSPVMPGRGRLSHALVAVLSLALLLFSLIGMLAAITGAHALIANRLSVSSAAARPTKTPPSRHSPTPTTVPSPTFTALPTTIATVPTSATPPVKATTRGIIFATPSYGVHLLNAVTPGKFVSTTGFDPGIDCLRIAPLVPRPSWLWTVQEERKVESPTFDGSLTVTMRLAETTKEDTQGMLVSVYRSLWGNLQILAPQHITAPDAFRAI